MYVYMAELLDLSYIIFISYIKNRQKQDTGSVNDLRV